MSNTFESYTGHPITLTPLALSVYRLAEDVEDLEAEHLSVTLEDGNLEDVHIHEAITHCRRPGETRFMEALLTLSENERMTVWGMLWGDVDEDGADLRAQSFA